MGRIYTLYKAFTATADAAVNVQMVQSGTIRQIQITTAPDLDADGESYQVELGFGVTMQGRIHDSQGALATVAEVVQISGTGESVAGKNVVIPCAYSVKAGDKLYLHGLLSGTVDVKCTVLVTVT